ncbi:hypothetical protein EDD18DRAFT_1102925 [Armillaria luteobubalina]|uniref:DUF6535 domain-containing protein n=1 Tax=Armillaria luteobubalina TaxID=153913 RepID=A0AA39UQZ2_9AGAR|nr:hypothetical protein EDD18DRAFT_1102925 [Armillaria luteobubalina]
MQTHQESETDNKTDEVTKVLGGTAKPNVNSVVEESDLDGNDNGIHQTKHSSETSKPKRLFGLSRPQTATRKEDAQYEETGSNARVWRVYQEESTIHDGNMVEEARDHVDVLLIFAGLFSAVVTTLIVQTSQNLQANYSQVSASLLLQLVLIQYSVANGTTPPSLSAASLDPSFTFTPSTVDVWLFLNLTTALVGVLVKQWFHYYVALPSGTVRERCFVRQYRYTGIQKWKVPIIIGLLPVLMHLALAIFFAGLVLFLHPLQAQLSWFIGIGTVSLVFWPDAAMLSSMHYSVRAYPSCVDEGDLRVRVTSTAHKLLKDSLNETADGRQMPLPGMELRVDRLLRSQNVFPYYWPKTPTGIKVKYVEILVTQSHGPLGNPSLSDSVQVSLCCTILRASGRRQNHPRQDFDSPAIVDFETSVSQLSHSIISDGVISMVSAEFDPFPDHPASVWAAGAAVLFLLHQLALLPPDASPEEAHLTRVQDWPQELRGNSDVFHCVEGLIIRAAKDQGSQQSDKHLAFLVNAYQFAVKADPSRCSLESREPPVLEIFYQVRFLETLARRGDLVRFGFGSCWGGVVDQYITILSEARGGSSSVDAPSLKKHVDDLHQPENLLVACFLLRTRYRKDALLSLACLRPSDLVWVDCRRRFHELANADKHYFGDADHADAEERKKHIHEAVIVLEQFFSRHTFEEGHSLIMDARDTQQMDLWDVFYVKLQRALRCQAIPDILSYSLT